MYKRIPWDFHKFQQLFELCSLSSAFPKSQHQIQIWFGTDFLNITYGNREELSKLFKESKLYVCIYLYIYRYIYRYIYKEIDR